MSRLEKNIARGETDQTVLICEKCKKKIVRGDYTEAQKRDEKNKRFKKIYFCLECYDISKIPRQKRKDMYNGTC